MPKVVIQAGHQNIENNVDVLLRPGRGAPGEVGFTGDVANQVSGELRKRGFEVKQVDANANSDPSVTNVDWDLFLAIHYEADVHNTNGYFVAAPDPSVDAVNPTSVKIRDIISAQYSTLGIPKHNEWENANTKFFYMWKYLSAKTPCVLIECGVGWRVPKDSDLLNSNSGRPRVVEHIVRGICKAFNVSYDLTPSQPPVDPTIVLKEQIRLLKEVNTTLTQKITALQTKIDKARTDLQ